MSLLNSVFSWFTGGDEEKKESVISPLDKLHKSYADLNSVDDEILKAQKDFDEQNQEYSLKIAACDKLITGNNSEQAKENKGFLVEKLTKAENQFISIVQDLNTKKQVFQSEIEGIEQEVLVKSLEAVALLEQEQRDKVQEIMSGWSETEMIDGVKHDHYSAMVKAIELATGTSLTKAVATKSAAPIISIGEAKKKAKVDLTGHYVNAIIRRDGKLLFVKRAANDDLGPGTYCLPGGKIETGESIPVAMCRELKEETSLECDSDCFWLKAKAKCSDGKWAFYLSGSPSGDVKLLDGENENARWMTDEEWLEENLLLDLKDHLIALEIPQLNIEDIPTIQKAEEGSGFFFEG